MEFVPGFLQGITRVLISHPFDYVRLYLQTNSSDSITDFFKKNSYRDLYRGVSIPLLTVPIERAIQLRCYENLNGYTNPFISGAVCGVVSSCVSLPSQYVSNNYILQKNKALFEFVRGLRSFKIFASGYKPELLRSIVSSSLYLGVYGSLRATYGNDTKQSVVNSSLASLSAWTISYPLETIKVEQQVRQNPSVIAVVKHRIHSYGILNLWKGILPIYIRTLPSSAIGMVVYEKAKDFVRTL
jgi:hypothetical protein